MTASLFRSRIQRMVNEARIVSLSVLHKGKRLTLPSRSRRVLRTAGMGHGQPAPSAARRVRSGISERTVAETRSNREDAPIAIVAK